MNYELRVRKTISTIGIGILLSVIIVLSGTFAFAQPKPATTPPAGAPKPATGAPTTTAPKPAAGAPTTTPAKPTDPAAPKPTPDPVSSAPAGGLKLGSDQRQPLNLFLRDSLTVKALWSTILRIADTFVVLFLLAIAFATILHISYDTYGIKKAILPLIIGIILSHFSLVIVQNFTDFAQVMGAGMYNAASSGKGALGMATNISATFFSGGLEALGANGGKVTSDMLIGLFAFAFVSGAYGAVFLGLLVLALIMIAIPTLLILVLSFLLYARFYLITVLTIIAPLAWLTIMWSPVQGFFKTWWKQFTQWVFMAPVALFFIWLAIAFSQSSMANGEANFGTYLLSLVMLYLAIQTPFKMGGQVTATMDKYGRGRALPMAQKYGGMAANAGLNKLGSAKIPGKWNKEKKTFADMGVAGTDVYKKAWGEKFGPGAEHRKMVNTAALLGMGRYGNKEQAERVRRNAEEERLEKSQWAPGSTQQDRKDKIENGNLKPEEALKVIEMMAQKGEDAMGALEAYIKNTGKDPKTGIVGKYGEKSPYESREKKDVDFCKRLNNSVEATKPYLMKADAETKADPIALKAFNDRKQRAMSSLSDKELIRRGSYDANKIEKFSGTADQDEAITKLTDEINKCTLNGRDYVDHSGRTWTKNEVTAERDRIARVKSAGGVASVSHIHIGNDIADKRLSTGDMVTDLARHIRTNPTVAAGLKALHAPGRMGEVADEV